MTAPEANKTKDTRIETGHADENPIAADLRQEYLKEIRPANARPHWS